MKSAALVLFVTIFTAGTAISQVHIVERAVISPGQLKTVGSVGGKSNHDIRYEFRWDTPYAGRVYILYPCGDTTVYGSGGLITVDFPSAPAGQYDFEGQVGESYGEGPVMHVSYKLYQDNVLKDSISTTMQPYSGCCWTVWPGLGNFALYKTSYYSGFKIYLFPDGWRYFIADNPPDNGGYAGMDITGVYGCSKNTWTPTPTWSHLRSCRDPSLSPFTTPASKWVGRRQLRQKL